MTPARNPVELHIVSDSTGETAARLVAGARGAVPGAAVRGDPPPARRVDRRPEADRQSREGPPGGDGLHARRPRDARGDADALPQRAVALLRPARAPDRVDREGLRDGRADDSRRAAAARLDVLQADGGDRVRGQVRRRGRDGAAGGGRRARRRLTHLEDAALDLPRLPRPQGGERADRARGSPRRRSSTRSTRSRSSA